MLKIDIASRRYALHHRVFVMTPELLDSLLSGAQIQIQGAGKASRQCIMY